MWRLYLGLLATAAADTRVFKLQLQTCGSGRTPTIHGLWPEWAEYCSGLDFNETSLISIQEKLDTEWLSCGYTDKNAGFWKHEWDRHGKCAVSGVPEHFSNEKSYFSKALQLYEEKYRKICEETIKNVEGRGICAYCLDSENNWEETKCPVWPPPSEKANETHQELFL